MGGCPRGGVRRVGFREGGGAQRAPSARVSVGYSLASTKRGRGTGTQKQKAEKGSARNFTNSLILWCAQPESNRHDRNDRGILSPLRLPVSPWALADGERREGSITTRSRYPLSSGRSRNFAKAKAHEATFPAVCDAGVVGLCCVQPLRHCHDHQGLRPCG